MTRDLPWGVPIPEDVAKAAGVDAEGKMLYVWFDAPIGYISATREWAEQKGDPELWKRYWQDEETKLVHFIGKDNIVFHCIIFPAMLKLHGDYVLPDAVPANEFLNLKGAKFSTSRGVAVWLHEYLEDFPADYLRYALTKMLPEHQDSDFGWEDFQSHVNNELADTLGNFVNRALTFALKYCDGKVPPLDDPMVHDREALEALEGFADRVGDHLEHYRFRDAMNEAMGLARMGNKFFNDSEPWATRKTDMKRCGNTLHVSLQLCASLSILFEPFLPHAAEKTRRMLGLEGMRSSAPGGDGKGRGWEAAKVPLLEAGQALGEAEILFTKIEDEAIAAQIQKLADRAKPPVEGKPYEPMSDEIVYDDFAKLDLRVGVVREAEKVKKSKKLIKCQVDLGFEQRQILAGVAEHLSPEDLLGKHLIVVANLKPRKMMGMESQGMLLMATDRDGKLSPVTTVGEPGSVVS